MIICVNSKGKKARVAKSISDERDFMIKIVWDIEGHYIMIKWPMNQENIIVINIDLKYFLMVFSKIMFWALVPGDEKSSSWRLITNNSYKY